MPPRPRPNGIMPASVRRRQRDGVHRDVDGLHALPCDLPVAEDDDLDLLRPLPLAELSGPRQEGVARPVVGQLRAGELHVLGRGASVRRARADGALPIHDELLEGPVDACGRDLTGALPPAVDAAPAAEDHSRALRGDVAHAEALGAAVVGGEEKRLGQLVGPVLDDDVEVAGEPAGDGVMHGLFGALDRGERRLGRAGGGVAPLRRHVELEREGLSHLQQADGDQCGHDGSFPESRR